jgi:hypothetical protein
MRLMSFAITERQLLEGTKTVTRRTGWIDLKPGEKILAVRRATGMAKVVPLCVIEVVSVRRERLDAVNPADVLAEGFPHWTNQVDEFVRLFCATHTVPDHSVQRLNRHGSWTPTRRPVRPDDEVTRIEFRKAPGSEAPGTQTTLAVG